MSDYERNADVSKTLTDKWKKGELPSGWYWVELKEGTFADGKKSIILDYLFEFTNDFERHPYLVEQVLAKVPSYEQWQKLKKLLKESKEVLELVAGETIDFANSVDECIDKINQVLADNKIQANTVACNKIQEKNR